MSRAKGTRWASAPPWTVPRDIQCAPPTGMRWAGPGRCLILGPTTLPQTVRPEDWGDAAATEIQAVMLVSAIRVSAECIGRWPVSHAVFTLRPTLAHVRIGERLTVSPAESRTGELWTFPLAHAVGPLRQPADFAQQPSNQP